MVCALVRDALPPFAYGLVALTLSGALVAIPLLGELAWLLRSDEAADWVETLPARRAELRIARTLHLLCVLWLLALGSLVPAALFAPSSTELVPRILLPLCGLGLATAIAALLLVVQGVVGGRAEALLVLFQTLVVVGVVVGLIAGIRRVPELAHVTGLGTARGLWAYPPAWFAAPLAASQPGEPARWWLPAGAFAAALLVLCLSPAPRAVARGTRGWLDLVLRPARALATRAWVRRDERGIFDLVYDALPREREVILRTYPMIGIPLAFLIVAASGDGQSSQSREDLLALLLFTAAIYLPILLTHVPASASHAARWLHESAPVPAGAVVTGTVKALAVRFLLPLYLALGLLAWFQAGPTFALRLTPAGALASLLVLRRLYRVCVRDLPLSISPDQVRTDLDWLGLLGGLAMFLTVLALVASRVLTSFLASAALVLALLALDAVLQRRTRRELG